MSGVKPAPPGRKRELRHFAASAATVHFTNVIGSATAPPARLEHLLSEAVVVCADIIFGRFKADWRLCLMEFS